MAYADYRLCDKCECKAFYDANLNYDFTADASEHIRGQHLALDYLGDWKVLCKECAKKYICIIVERAE